METPRDRRERYAFLDALRGVAVAAVVGTHLVQEVTPLFDRWLLDWFVFGNFGVLAFFLVSGFIIPASLEAGSLARFWLGRAFRLLPLYLAGTALLLGLLYAGLAAPPRAVGVVAPGLLRAHPALVALANALPIQEFAGWPKANGVYWTLAFELAFYALLSLAALVGWHRRSAPLAAGALLVALVVEGLPAHLLGATLPRHGSLVYLALMFAGTVAYRWVRGEVPDRVAAGVAALAVLTAVATIPPQHVGTLIAAPVAILASRLGALAAFGLALALRRRTPPGWLLWLGRVSYSLYVLHVVAMATMPRTGVAALDGALLIACSLGMAWAAERWIERPGVALGKRLAGGHRRAHHGSTPAPPIATQSTPTTG